MKRITLFCTVVAALGTSVVVWRQHFLAELRQSQNLDLVHEETANGTNITDAALQQDLIRMHEQVRELPKLRNEVGQLRTVRTELAAARAENVRLLEAKSTGAALPREAPPGFVSKEQLKNGGFATPEAAVETFFWATRESRLDLMIESLSPEHRDREKFESLPAETRAQQISGFMSGKMGNPRISNFSDFTVTEREQISEDTIVLSLRSSVGTKAAKYRLKRFGTEWKIDDIPL